MNSCSSGALKLINSLEPFHELDNDTGHGANTKKIH